MEESDYHLNPPDSHSQFLDLTNGKGGELQPAAAVQPRASSVHYASNTATTTSSSILHQSTYATTSIPTVSAAAAGVGSGSSSRHHHASFAATFADTATSSPAPATSSTPLDNVMDQGYDDDDDDDDDEKAEGSKLLTSMGASQKPTTAVPHSAIGAYRAAMTSTATMDSSPESTAATSTNAGAALGMLNPLTPGKVVESGQEQTGRWTKEEHEAFLEALNMYGKEWKKVAAKVKTRTVVQTRTHAQKYFQKLQKTKGGKMESLDDDPPTGTSSKNHRHHSGSIDMGDLSTTSSHSAATPGTDSTATAVAAAAAAGAAVGTSATKRPYSHKKKRPLSGGGSAAGSAAGIAAAPKLNRRSSSATISAAQVISNLSKNTNAGNHVLLAAAPSLTAAPLPPPPLGSFLTTNSTSNITQQRAHGFSTEHDVVVSSSYSASSAPSSTTSWGQATTTAPLAAAGGGGVPSSSSMMMKIVAPDPMMTMSKGKFPEPSPAATGKRKLAEIAAARMLAGVIDANNNHNNKQRMMANEHANNEEEDDDDGPPTPPLDGAHPGPANIRSSSGFSLKEAPTLPPLFADKHHGGGGGKHVGFGVGSSRTNNRGGGLSLQILNPDRLGVTEKRRRADGEHSPVTPWDGQLEALVSEKAIKSGFGGVDVNVMADSATTPTTPDNKGDRHQYHHDADQMVDAASSSTATALSSKRLAVSGPGTAFDRSPLHQAVCEMDIESLQAQLDDVNSNNALLSCQDKAGYCPIHTACALRLADPSNAVAASEMVRTLLAGGADATIVDRQGNTPLHWAARAGDRDVAEMLLVKNCALDAKNDQGETPLHWGMRSGRNGFEVVVVLLDNGARPSCLNNEYRRPMDVAAEGFLDEEDSIASLRKRDGLGKQRKMTSKELKKALKDRNRDVRDCRSNYLMRSAHSRTLVLHHPECLEHVPKSSMDWEAPDRVLSIMRRVAPCDANTTTGILPHEVTVSTEFERAQLDLLSRVHSTEYLSFVQDLSKDLQKQLKENDGYKKRGGDSGEEASDTPPHVVPFTPMVQRSMIKVKESDVKLGINSDTAFSAGSLKAARRAAGAVQHAVDCVLVGRNRNAFCVVRPPGHHAGVNGLLDGGESCGFCIFNNVAAGALYAISDDRLLCDRCAIVDIDVHHGNGTEEIVQKCHDPSKLFFFSIHLYDNEKKKRGGPNNAQYKFYPGTGSEVDLAMNIINVPIVPLWKEQAPLAAPAARTHNTRQKKTRSSADSQDESPIGTPRSNGRGSDGGSETGSTTTSNNLSQAINGLSGRLAYRKAIQDRLLPALRAFNPDLILISAGFDACKGDVGNARHERGGKERLGLDLEPEDYAWTTNKILEIADICCQGRVVSVLEGGYGRTAIPSAPPPPTAAATGNNNTTAAAAVAFASDQQALAEEASLDRTIFADCAIRHLHAMIDPYDIEHRFTPLR